MIEVLASGQDFAQFACLFSFAICAAATIVLAREEPGRAWLSLFGFFFLQALASLAVVFSAIAPLRGALAHVMAILQAAALAALLAFVNTLLTVVMRKIATLLVSLVLVALAAAASFVFSPAISTLFSSLVLGLPGGYFALRFFFSDPAIRGHGRPWLVANAVLFAILILVGLADSAVRLFAPVSFPGGMHILLALVSLALAATLAMHQWRSFARANRGYGRPQTRFAIASAFLVLPVVFGAGWLATDQIGTNARNTLVTEYDSEAAVVASLISGVTGEIDRDAELIASLSQTRDFASLPVSSDRDTLQAVLEPFAVRLYASCILLDARGNVLASSPRIVAAHPVELPDLDDYSFRQGLAGYSVRYFSLSISAREGWYFSAVPVVNGAAKAIAVMVIARRISSFFPRVRTDPDVFLIDKDSNVMFARDSAFVHTALWSVTPSKEDIARGTRQFGFVWSTPILTGEPVDRALVPWRGSHAIIARSFLGISGWSIVVLGPTDEILLYRMAGFLMTILMSLVLCFFSSTGMISLLDEARVERSESRYKTLVQGLPDWISIVDDTGAFLFTNSAGRARLGVTAPGTAVPDMAALIGPENVALVARYALRASAAGTASFEMDAGAAGAETRQWHLTMIPVNVETERPAVLLIGRDITDMRRAEAQLVQAERRAALGTLTAGVAHQFNNINAVTLGYLQVLQTDEGVPAAAQRYIASMREAVERAVELTSRLMLLSAPDAPVEVVPLGRNAAEVAESMRQEIEAEGTVLEVRTTDTRPVLIDPRQLDFLVRALLDNARHAVLGQGKRLIRLSTGEETEDSFIRVEDTGVGIAPSKLSSIFTPFFSQKGENAPAGSPQAGVRGAGLSLALAHSIVATQGGTIEVQSTPGVAPVMTVKLPSATPGGIRSATPGGSRSA